MKYPEYFEKYIENISIKSIDEIRSNYQQLKNTGGCSGSCDKLTKNKELLDKQFEILSKANECFFSENYKKEINDSFVLFDKAISHKRMIISVHNSYLDKCGIRFIDYDSYDVSIDEYYYRAGFLYNNKVIKFNFPLFPYSVFTEIDQFLFNEIGLEIVEGFKSCDAGCNDKTNDFLTNFLANKDFDNKNIQNVIKKYDQILSTFKFIENTSIADIIQEDKEIEYLEDFEFQNLPDYVYQEQKGETYKLENYIFQFIRQRNLNTPLPISDNNFKWAGVLYSENSGLSWNNFFVIDNPIDYNGNEVKYNPVGMFVKNNKLYLDISDDRGAGSGEGNLLRYYTEDGKTWVRDECLYLIPEEYYFINKINGSVRIDPFSLIANSECVYYPVSLCTDESFGTCIGGYVYPIDPKYKNLHFLGQLFTAANCGQERLSQIEGVVGENYTFGPRIILKDNPSQELVNVFRSIGFNCDDKLPDNECKEWSPDEFIKISELLKLEPYYSYFSSDDCENCG